MFGHHATLLVGDIVTFRSEKEKLSNSHRSSRMTCRIFGFEYLLWYDSAEFDWFPVFTDDLVEQILPVDGAGHTIEVGSWESVTISVSHISKLAFIGHK